MPDTLILRGSHIEVRERGQERTIAGYASRFYAEGVAGTEYEPLPGYVERVKRGAFKRAIKASDTVALYNHDPSRVLGRRSAGTLRLEERPDGLWFEVSPPRSPGGEDVYETVRRGDVLGASIQFDITAEGGREEFRRERRGDREVTVRTILDIGELLDVGPVTFPAFAATAVEARARGERAARAVQLAAREAELRTLKIL